MLSRCRVIVLKKLEASTIRKILERAVAEENIKIDQSSIEYLANFADGDARTALNCLQIASDIGPSVTLKEIKEAVKRSHVLYDRKGDEHFHCASALQKSIRGSDDNAALYWCMRMLNGGEDTLFIARRINLITY